MVIDTFRSERLAWRAVRAMKVHHPHSPGHPEKALAIVVAYLKLGGGKLILWWLPPQHQITVELALLVTEECPP